MSPRLGVYPKPSMRHYVSYAHSVETQCSRMVRKLQRESANHCTVINDLNILSQCSFILICFDLINTDIQLFNYIRTLCHNLISRSPSRSYTSYNVRSSLKVVTKLTQIDGEFLCSVILQSYGLNVYLLKPLSTCLRNAPLGFFEYTTYFGVLLFVDEAKEGV